MSNNQKDIDKLSYMILEKESCENLEKLEGLVERIIPLTLEHQYLQ